MQQQYHRLSAILAANREPLAGVADAQKGRLVDPVGGGDRHGRLGPVLAPRTVAQAAREDDDQDRHKTQEGLEDPPDYAWDSHRLAL